MPRLNDGLENLENWLRYAYKSRKSTDFSESQTRLRQGPLDVFNAYKCETINIQGAD